MDKEYETRVAELMKAFPQEAKRYAESLVNLYSVGPYLDYMRRNENEGLEKCDSYVVKQFSYLEYLMEAVLLETHRLVSADMGRDWFVVEWEPGEYKLVDFTSGKFRQIRMYSRREYEEEINRRTGINIY